MYIEAWVFWGIIIVAICVIASLIAKNNKALDKTKTMIEDMTRAYDETVSRLITYSWRITPEKKQKEMLNALAEAVVAGADHSVTTRSLLDTTDHIAMCRMFKSFTLRENLTPPDILFQQQDPDELDSMKETALNDIKKYLGVDK